jgi:rhodanese-related sulfurtransferase
MKLINVKELYARMESGEKLHLVDVREPNEHTDFNIGGILLPLGDIRSADIETIEHLKKEELICYCRSGNRSGQAALILETLGFENVVNVTGGMLDWQEHFSA